MYMLIMQWTATCVCLGNGDHLQGSWTVLPHGTSLQDNCDYLSLQRSLWLNDDDTPGTMLAYDFFGWFLAWIHWKTGWSCWQATQPDTDRFTQDTTGLAGFLEQIKERLWVWRKEIRAGIYPNRLWKKSSLRNWPRIKQEINRFYVHCSITEHTFMTAS